MMNWEKLSDTTQLDDIKRESSTLPVLIFKHSTRCSISAAALGRIERNWKENDLQLIKPYYLDLIAFRSVSNQIESDFNVEHQSPQVLVIKNGRCVYDASHMSIALDEILKHA